MRRASANRAIDDLIAEINGSTHHVVISCEHFSIAIRSFEKFRTFIARLRNCGLAVIVVCYVRSPHDRAYNEVVAHYKAPLAHATG